MKKYFFIIIAIGIVAAAGVYFRRSPPPEPEVHYHAGFLVYVNGKLHDFSKINYMNVAPCAVKGSQTHMDEQLEKAHLHDGVGDVVHIHRSGAVWGDLFKNIKFKFPENTPLVGFVNGIPNEDILDTPIKTYTSVLIITGDMKGIDTKQVVTKEHMVETESKSETCGT